MKIRYFGHPEEEEQELKPGDFIVCYPSNRTIEFNPGIYTFSRIAPMIRKNEPTRCFAKPFGQDWEILLELNQCRLATQEQIAYNVQLKLQGINIWQRPKSIGVPPLGTMKSLDHKTKFYFQFAE